MADQMVVFDLDGTLVRDDSFSRFLYRLLVRTPRRRVATAVTLPLIGSMFAVPDWRIRTAAVNLWLWIGTAGLPDADHLELAERFARRHAGRRTIPVAVARLREHLVAGDRVAVVTGSEEHLARAMLRILGMDGVQIVGSTLRRRWGALAIDVHCYGPVKLQRLQAAGIRPPFARAYTDNAADLPLILAATERYLVAPRPRHLRRILSQAADCRPLEMDPRSDPDRTV